MADNINVTPGAGATVAADNIANVYYQRVKIALGADGSYDGDWSKMLGTADTAFTGIITVTNAGTAVQGSSVASTNGFFFKSHPDNTDTVWLFPSGAAKTSGFPLNAGEAIPLMVTNLNQVWFDADVSGEKICWVKA